MTRWCKDDRWRVVQVDEAAWREFQKLKEQLEQDKRDMAALTSAFVEHRAQTAADTLVCPALLTHSSKAPQCQYIKTHILYKLTMLKVKKAKKNKSWYYFLVSLYSRFVHKIFVHRIYADSMPRVSCVADTG